MDKKYRWTDTNKGKSKYSEKPRVSGAMCTTNPILTVLRLKWYSVKFT